MERPTKGYKAVIRYMELYNRIQDERTDRYQEKTVVLVHAQEDL